MVDRISVGRLGEICRKGDINFRFSTRSSAREGIKGHREVQRRRGDNYYSESSLSMLVQVNGREIEVHGRADGIEVTDEQVCLEEIKTIRVSPDQIPEDVMQSFWFQACTYGHILTCQEGLPGLIVRICLFHLDDGTEHTTERWFDASELSCLFSDAIGYYGELLDYRDAWNRRRNASLKAASFPFDSFRPGQRDMSVAVYRAASQNQQLVIQAPTGIGKTMGTLFPAVQALSSESSERIFYLSARNSTQVLAEQAIQHLSDSGIALRAVTLTAKDKICFSKGEPCDPERCQYANGYYDRVNLAIGSLLESEAISMYDRAVIESVAEEHEVCPFELGLDLSNSCDVIIGDYNYVFDPSVYLRRYFDDDARDSIVLIDEAHNLVDRGRSMYSAELLKSEFLDLARELKSVRPKIHRAAQTVNRNILAMKKEDAELLDSQGYLMWQDPPSAKFIKTLESFCEVAEESLRDENSFPGKEDLLSLYFKTLRFLRAIDWMDDKFALLLLPARKDLRLVVNCIDPSSQLGERMRETAAAVCFSATLQPQPYFKQMLGIQEETNWYRIESPFPPENLDVTLASYIDTSFRGRDQSVSALVELIHTMISARRGNYLVFFPSYDYLQKVVEPFEARYPEDSIIVQQRNMDDIERQQFLNTFDSTPVCGFAVMGSLFSEGVDLKGEKLIGAMVIGVGLPQIGIERDLIRDHFEGDGFDFAYRFPGLVRVLQTAGRVIRDKEDRGVVCLVDRRFGKQETLKHLPQEWQVTNCSNQNEVADSMARFWQSETDVAGQALKVDLRRTGHLD